jgi:hypothetical protein
MAQWSDRLTSHPLFNHLQNLGPAIDNALNRENLDPQAVEGLSRLKSVLAFTGRRLAGADPFILQFGVVDNLGNHFQAIITEVQQFTANGNIGHLTNANTNADAALTLLAQLNVPLTTEDFQAAKEAAEAYRKGLGTILSEVKSSSKKVGSELEALNVRTGELAAVIDSEKVRLATVSAEAQAKFLADQEARTKEFTATQKDQQTRNTALLTEYMQKLTTQDAEFTKQREEIAHAHEDELDALKEEFAVAATKLRDDINDRKVEVEKLVGVIGNLGVTSGYLKAANGARSTVWIWQGVTVAAMIGLIIVAVNAFLPAISGEFSWGGFAGRVFISLTFGVLAAYAASQADKYQKVERQNRRLALELEAMGPFIAPLSPEKQEEFRLNIGDRSFGHGDGSGGLDAKSPATLIDVFLHSKEFRGLVAEIVKASKT